MNHHLRSIFITFLSLFTFISSLMAQETPSDQCLYVMDVYHESSRESLEINLHDDNLTSIDGNEEATNTIRLGLMFSLRGSPTEEPLQVIGVGESSNFNGYFATPNSFSVGFANRLEFFPIGGDSVLDIVREAIRDGYENLERHLPEQQQGLSGRITTQLEGRALISLGLSHYVQLGDTFHIYPGNRDSDHCNTIRDSSPYLTTGTVADISDNISLLRINADGIGKFQEGDIVELDPSIDLAARKQGQEDTRDNAPLITLQIGDLTDITVHFIDRGYNSTAGNNRRNITPYIKYYLVEEAPPGFQVIDP